SIMNNLDGRQVLAFGVESVLVGDVVDGVPDVGGRVDPAEATADGEAGVLLTGVHQLGGLLARLAVRQLIAELVFAQADVVRWRLFHENDLVISGDGGSRQSNGHEGVEGNDLDTESLKKSKFHTVILHEKCKNINTKNKKNLDGWQVSAFGVESVLIGDVVDGVSDVGGRVDPAVATADGDALVFLAGVHQLGGFLTGFTVRQLIAELVSIQADVVRWRLFHENYLVLQAALRSSEGDSDDGGEGNDLKYE
ncbi:hypothetical protein X777_16499, partial [Ooceraea biroi]